MADEGIGDYKTVHLFRNTETPKQTSYGSAGKRSVERSTKSNNFISRNNDGVRPRNSFQFRHNIIFIVDWIEAKGGVCAKCEIKKEISRGEKGKKWLLRSRKTVDCPASIISWRQIKCNTKGSPSHTRSTMYRQKRSRYIPSGERWGHSERGRVRRLSIRPHKRARQGIFVGGERNDCPGWKCARSKGVNGRCDALFDTAVRKNPKFAIRNVYYSRKKKMDAVQFGYRRSVNVGQLTRSWRRSDCITCNAN